ncbi:STP1 protein [Plasmodium ovale curtisi]|uniref:STP1 protein n=1 Tax=Plasmodium ovale curtisi TaxID=864141 RepID=A0A1A8XB85_PLAOA|nr:STP1 protein [Plasmodium ovale curtisi]
MGDYSGYTTNTRDVGIVVLLSMVKSDVKKIIRKYGHKNCGLMHEELCEKIKEIIYEKKNIVLNLTDDRGKQKLNSEWRSQRNEFFNKLFKNEGFINVCYPQKEKGNPNLQKLKLKHIEFCKEKDVRRLALEKNNEYSFCRQYNSWIDTQRTSFTHEYLDNVRDYTSKTVHKYFSTKEHPGGHDPRGTYHKSKLDCEIYNPNSKKYQKKPVEQAPKNEPQLPRVPNIRQGSPRKDGKSVEDRDTASAKTKPDVKKLSQTEPPPDSLTSSLIKTKVDKTVHGPDISLKPKAPDSSVNRDQVTKEATRIKTEPPTNMSPPARDEAPPQAGNPLPPPRDSKLTPAIQSVHVPNTTISLSLSSSLSTVKDTTSGQTPSTPSSLTITSASSLDSVLPSPSPPPSDPLSNVVVTKDQDTPSQSTITPVTSANTHSIHILPEPSAAVPSLAQPQPPAVSTPPAITALQELGTPASSSASTFTNTVTSTTAAPAAVTIPTMSTTHELISSAKEATSTSSSQESPPTSAAVGSEATASATARDLQQTVIPAHTSLSGSDTAKFSVQTKPDRDPGTILVASVLPKPKDSVQSANNTLSKDTQKAPENPSKTNVTISDSNVQRIPHQIDQQNNTRAVQHPPNKGVVSLASDKSGASVNTHKVNTKTVSKDDSKVRTNKNDKPNIIPEGIPPLTHIVPTFLVILGTLTLLFQLYKYTPFGFLLGRRRKRKKQDLRRIFEIPEKRTYEYPNITERELEDPNLVRQTKENDVYIKLLKINRYKQEMQKRKKKKKTTLIEVHMEIFEEYKKDEWELHKGDFLEICLREFINEENDFYSNLMNSELNINNIKNEKTIEDIQKQQHLWKNWIENHRNILEEWKKDEWFLILKNEWKKEKNIYQEKIHNLKENILNEPETHSIVSQKDIWKQWISKQATLIKMFNEEDWFKALVDEQNKGKVNYGVKYNDNAIVTNMNGSENKNPCNKPYERKKIIEKLMVQIHMMVLEECIKEDIMKNKEISIDNYIKSINNKNIYEQKSYIPECASDGFDVSEFKEINTYVNK